jgi:epoxyqueuosine reductase
MSASKQNTQFIKNEALKLGFLEVGISEAVILTEEEARLQNWLNIVHHGDMDYMQNHFEKRIDPTELVPGAKSVISFLYNYFTDKETDKSSFKISRYAYGKDYHNVLKKKLKTLLQIIKRKNPEAEGRYFVDSAPVLERAWARKSGLGWIGKSTMLINPKAGSFFFLAELVLNIELEYNTELISDHCGKCTRCIEACPTHAISEQGYQLDARKCISYLTIENRKEIPEEFSGKMSNYIFGCDICQIVCPWNKFATEHKDNNFLPDNQLMNMNDDDWQGLIAQRFNELFESSPVKRTKFSGLRRNIDFISHK